MTEHAPHTTGKVVDGNIGGVKVSIDGEFANGKTLTKGTKSTSFENRGVRLEEISTDGIC